MTPPLVIIESPHAAGSEQVLSIHIEYARACLRDSLLRGEAPFASHAMYAHDQILDDNAHDQILDDNIPAERTTGILAGWAWMAKAELVAIYHDLGVSRGMLAGIKEADRLGIPKRFRTLGPELTDASEQLAKLVRQLR